MGASKWPPTPQHSEAPRQSRGAPRCHALPIGRQGEVYHVKKMKNFELARLFYEMATLLEVHDESRFRVRAYQRAAQTLEALAEDVGAVAARGELQKLPAIGRDLALRIEEYLATGRIAQLDTLRGGLPPSFLGLLEIRGLGPRTAKLLHDRLGVDSVDRLEALCRSGEILSGSDE